MQLSGCLAHSIFIHIFCLFLYLRTVWGSNHMLYPSPPIWSLFSGFGLIISCIVLPSYLILCRFCHQWHCCFTYKWHSGYCMVFGAMFPHTIFALFWAEGKHFKKIHRKFSLLTVLKITCRNRAQSTMEKNFFFKQYALQVFSFYFKWPKR